MSSGFKEHELVKVQGRDFPVIGGRLRIAHEQHREKLSIVTEIVEYQLDVLAVARATIETLAGKFTATGTATQPRDPKLADSLVELAESRAVARALRYAGIGVECCGYEELGEGEVLGEDQDPHRHRSLSRGRPNGGENGRRQATPATGAQRRAIESLARRLGREVSSVLHGIIPGADIESLTLTEASSIIDRLKTKAGNGHVNGYAAEERR